MDRTVDRRFANVIAELRAEVGELVAFEERQFGVREIEMFVDHDYAGAVRPSSAVIEVPEGHDVGSVGERDSEVVEVCGVGDLMPTGPAPLVLGARRHRGSVDGDLIVAPARSASRPVHDRIDDLCAAGDRQRADPFGALRRRIDVCAIGIDPDVEVRHADLSDVAISQNKFAFALDRARHAESDHGSHDEYGDAAQRLPNPSNAHW